MHGCDGWLRVAFRDGSGIKLAQEMMHTTFEVIIDARLTGRGSMDVNRIEQAITQYLSVIGWVTAMTMMRLAAVWPPRSMRISIWSLRMSFAASTSL